MDGGFTKLFKLCIFKILQTNPRLGKMRYKTILPSRFFLPLGKGVRNNQILKFFDSSRLTMAVLGFISLYIIDAVCR